LKKYLPKFIFWTLIICVGIVLFLQLQRVTTNPDKFWDSIMNGVISGVVTALLIFIFQILWKQNFLVWIENLLFQDVKIEGEWTGFVVPFIGLKDLDKIQRDIAWREFKKMQKEKTLRKRKKKSEQTEPTTASVINPETGEEQEISAEVILHSSSKKLEDGDSKETETKRVISISPTPIIIKAQFKRVGHSVTGKIIEIGGASDIHTYSVNGTFKNLILTATYESTSDDHIDRGALSLMLLRNGVVFDGFFSSYSDGDHRMVPMRCFLSKKNKLNDTEN